MSKKDLFGDDLEKTGGAAEFAALLNRSLTTHRRLKTGDTFSGEILSIGKEEAFVSTGSPVDGAIPLSELLDDKKQVKYKVGEVIEVQVVRVREGEILLRRKNSSAVAEEIESLEDAFDMELPIEGKVTEAVKGGFRVTIHGKQAFCPMSQMDLRGGHEPSEYIGKKYEFIITQFDERGRNLVISRRKLLELQRAESEGEFLEKHQPGEILHGTITRLEKFGAFCRLADSNVEGLIPISELAWGRIGDPSEVVSIGQAVDVQLLRIVEEGDRMKVSFSLKQAGGEGDPWMRVTERFPVGSISEGTIERRETYGLFVNLAPGITGLMPKSKWRDRVDGSQYENRKKGEKIKVMVDEIKFEEKRLTLAPPSEDRDETWRTHSAASTGQGTGHGMGTFADLFKDLKPTKKS